MTPNKKLLHDYFSELSKRSLEVRRVKYGGAKGFREFMRNIAKMKRPNRKKRAKESGDKINLTS